MLRALLAATVLACSAPAAAPAATAAPPTPTAAAAPAGSLTFTVASGSKATVRVRETLAGLTAPNDAVLETSGVTGSFTLNADGTFDASSRIVADLSALRSDSSTRDRFIKEDTLETRRFPNAEFAPRKASGLTLPLPASGDLAFTVEGALTVHGVTKDVAFEVKATRAGNEVRATSTAAPALRFGDFGMRIPRVASVVSIVDEIRLEVFLAAQQR